MSFLTNKSLENLIQYSSLKNKVISENIANIGSKNYQRKDVSFKNILAENMQSAIKSTNTRHLQADANATKSDKFEISVERSEDNISGVNNVDIDREMAELAENSLRFKFASRKLGKYYKNIQDVIKSGR